MPLSDLLDELFRLYRRHFSLIVGVSLIVVLPSLIWTLVTGTYKLTASSYTNLVPTAGSTATPSFNSTELQRLAGLFALGALGSIILSPFSVGAVFRAVTDVALGRPTTVAGVLQETLRRYFTLLGLVLLVAVFVIAWIVASIVGFVLLILPFFAVQAAAAYFLVRWSLVVAAMMAEDIGPVRGLGRSWNLVAGSWWRTLGILVVVAILQSVIAFALGLFFGLIVAVALSGDLRLAVTSAGSTLLGAIVSPIVTIGVVLLYFDLRTRKEGLDLDQLARDATPGQAPA